MQKTRVGHAFFLYTLCFFACILAKPERQRTQKGSIMTTTQKKAALAERRARFTMQMIRLKAETKAERNLERRCTLLQTRIDAIQQYGRDIAALCA
jgi:hypothetical protein